MGHYRTRRTWVLAEALLGYLAFLIGLMGSGLVPGGRLAGKLEQSGDDVIWALLFMGGGAAMAAAAACDALWRRSENERFVRILARVRCDLHVMLCFAWTYGLYTVFRLEHVSVIFLALAPVMAAYHLYGAWEHTKARILGADAKYHGLYDRVRRGGLGGHDT
jgi:small-conductance mechanosensitive channel